MTFLEEQLRVTPLRRGTTLTLMVVGELDLATESALQDVLAEAEGGEDPPETVVLDLRGVTYMGASGINVLLAADRRRREQGRRLVLVPGSRAVDRILDVCELTQHFELADAPVEAVRSAG